MNVLKYNYLSVCYFCLESFAMNLAITPEMFKGKTEISPQSIFIY